MTEETDLRILLVEDDSADAQIFSRYAADSALYGVQVDHVTTSEQALGLVSEERYDLVFLDLSLGETDSGLETLRRIGVARPDLPVIILTGSGDEQAAVETMKSGAADYLLKDDFSSDALERSIRYVLEHHRSVMERKKAEEELRQTLTKLRQALGATIRGMALTAEVRDPYTAGHQRAVADLARTIGTAMGLSPEEIDGIRMAGVIHDLGKVHVPAEILSKPGPLSELEYSLVKTHCEVAYDILKTIEFPWPVAEIVYEHHERMDGSGYPRGLSGDEILMEARVIAVADVVEAMLSQRPYRPPRGLDATVRHISEKKGILYDPGVVDLCLKVMLEEGSYGQGRADGKPT